MTYDYDLFVIGGGSGGVRAARVAAADGVRVALAEEDRMGGTCVIRGCVPKKLMVFASEFREAISDARAYGWDIGDGKFDWSVFRTKLYAQLDFLEGVYRRMLDTSGVTTYNARATVKDAHHVALSTGEVISAGHILIATGGLPVRPDQPGAELGITSNDIFHLEKLPASILIIDGGYVACEFAGIFNGLGSKVTQHYRGAQILRGFDGEARGMIADQMRDRGVDLHCGTTILAMEKRDDGIWVKSSNGVEAVYEQVLFATGRAPNTAGLGLREAGVALGSKGEVVVDDYSQSSVPSVYAVGDVTNRVQLTPVAIREGMAFVETVFRGNPTKVDHHLIPSAVFTQPEFGTIGLTEEAAREQGPIEVYSTSFRAMQHSFIGRNDRVLMKLIVSQATRKVLGCHIVADHAGEMIQLAGIAIKMGATKEDFDRTVAVHPTMAEELVTIKTPVRTA